MPDGRKKLKEKLIIKDHQVVSTKEGEEEGEDEEDSEEKKEKEEEEEDEE